MEWLIPICLFWILAATYIGGWPVTIAGGGGVRHVAGLIISFALFLIVWGALHSVLGGMGEMFFGLIVPTGVTALALPLLVWLAFLVVGVRVKLGGG